MTIKQARTILTELGMTLKSIPPTAASTAYQFRATGSDRRPRLRRRSNRVLRHRLGDCIATARDMAANLAALKGE